MSTSIPHASSDPVWTIRVDDREDPLSSQSIAELTALIRSQLSPALPVDVINKMASIPISLVYSRQLPSGIDGLFLPPSELRIRPGLMSGPNGNPTFVHEFFHAIHFVIHQDEEPWIREGLAQLFEYQVLGVFNSQNIAAAFKEPSTPLMGEYSVESVNPAQYGHSLLYFYYITENCGNQQLFWRIARGYPGVFGEAVVDRALRESKSDLPQCAGFKESARHFEISRFHNRISYAAKANHKIHYLHPTTLQTAVPRSSLSEMEAAQLARYQPVLLESGARLPKSIASGRAGFERVWLGRKYPYSVQWEAPAEQSSDWLQLVFKR